MSNFIFVCFNFYFLNLNGKVNCLFYFVCIFVVNGSEWLICKGVFKYIFLKEWDFIIVVGYCVIIYISWKWIFKFLNIWDIFFLRMIVRFNLNIVRNLL